MTRLRTMLAAGAILVSIAIPDALTPEPQQACVSIHAPKLFAGDAYVISDPRFGSDPVIVLPNEIKIGGPWAICPNGVWGPL